MEGVWSGDGGAMEGAAHAFSSNEGEADSPRAAAMASGVLELCLRHDIRRSRLGVLPGRQAARVERW